ncbi:hypothetical protein [Micromonospora carbonacea]|uniref:hypothetical protein n=1 Tax=Micromonospora carbonacea TaxID=47853 RepID=UPI003720077E
MDVVRAGRPGPRRVSAAAASTVSLSGVVMAQLAAGLLGVAVGVLVRATAGAIAIVTAATFLIPAFTPALPDSLARFVGTYWPSMAGRQLMLVHHDPNLPAPWAGFALLLLSVAVVLAAAFVVFSRRDA